MVWQFHVVAKMHHFWMQSLYRRDQEAIINHQEGISCTCKAIETLVLDAIVEQAWRGHSEPLLRPSSRPSFQSNHVDWVTRTYASCQSSSLVWTANRSCRREERTFYDVSGTRLYLHVINLATSATLWQSANVHLYVTTRVVSYTSSFAREKTCPWGHFLTSRKRSSVDIQTRLYRKIFLWRMIWNIR